MIHVESGRMFADNMKLLDYLAPAIGRNLVIYTSGDTLVRAFQAGNGTLTWTRAFDRPTTSAPVIAGRWIVVGTDRNYFYVLEEVY
jgi:outer membrane protein assembly factor BamB